MIPFRRTGDELAATFEQAEVEILMQLATDVQALLAGSESGSVDADSPSSRAIDRLLPAAYRDGAENDAEFRRFTSEGILDRKVRNAQNVVDLLTAGDVSAGAVLVNLRPTDAQAWLRALTDIRLTIAAGLGIEHDGDELLLEGRDRFVLEVYGWVGFVQESLVGALESDLS